VDSKQNQTAWAILVLVFLTTQSAASDAPYYGENPGVCCLDAKPKVIGNLGKPTKVLDIRGFLPLSVYSFADKKVGYYKFRSAAIVYLYYPKKQIDALHPWHFGLQCQAQGSKLAANFPITIIKEKDAKGEDDEWCKIAYAYTKGGKARKLYNLLDGGGTLHGGEPVSVLLTDSSAFIFITFRWSSLRRPDQTGQSLYAFEVSR